MDSTKALLIAAAVLSLLAAGWMTADRNVAHRELAGIKELHKAAQEKADTLSKSVEELTAKLNDAEGRLSAATAARSSAEEAIKKVEEIVATEKAKLLEAIGKVMPSATPAETPAAAAPANTPEPAAAETAPAAEVAPAETPAA